MELKIEYLPIKALKPYEKNTRKHKKKDVDNIARSIEKYGMCDAIGIWGEQNIIVEGHGRMLACKQLGIGFICKALENSSKKNEKVLDLFGGSGSTLIACEQLDRTCYMMELDPKYCDVIIKRWETLTGEKAVLIND